MLPDELTATSSFNVKDGKEQVDDIPRRGRGISRSRSVGFNEADLKVVEFDMLDEEVREMFWYSRDEYDIIKARNR